MGLISPVQIDAVDRRAETIRPPAKEAEPLPLRGIVLGMLLSLAFWLGVAVLWRIV